mgnify:CR=1 FL=1
MKPSTLAAIAVLTLGPMVSHAHACAFSAFAELPPSGLSDSQLARWKSLAGARGATRLLEKQIDLWDSADTVFVTRVVAHEHINIGSDERPFEVPRAELRPVQWLKGDEDPAQFILMATGLSSCGYLPDYPVFGAKEGQEFVVFARGPRLSEGWVLKILAPGQLLDLRSIEALKTAPRLPDTDQ